MNPEGFERTLARLETGPGSYHHTAWLHGDGRPACLAAPGVAAHGETLFEETDGTVRVRIGGRVPAGRRGAVRGLHRRRDGGWGHGPGDHALSATGRNARCRRPSR